MESEKALKAFNLISRRNRLHKISGIISNALATDEPQVSIVSFAEEGPMLITDKQFLKDIQRGIDYRIFEIDKEIQEL